MREDVRIEVESRTPAASDIPFVAQLADTLWRKIVTGFFESRGNFE